MIYAIIGSDDKALFKKYFDEVHNNPGKAMLMCYKHHEDHIPTIDSIYD